MSFEQTPPNPDQAPLPVAPPAVPPIYRQDEFVRRPSAWTRPMQMGVGIYLVLSTLYSIATQFIFATDFKAVAARSVAKSFKASGRSFTQADIDQAVNLGLTFALVFGIIFAILFIVLAILTVTGTRTWVFWVDLVFLALGVLSLLSVVTSFTDLANSQLPAGARPLALLFGVADVGLLVWMIVGLVKYGPWAQEKVPAAL
jgi:hypothetical protein